MAERSIEQPSELPARYQPCTYRVAILAVSRGHAEGVPVPEERNPENAPPTPASRRRNASPWRGSSSSSSSSSSCRRSRKPVKSGRAYVAKEGILWGLLG